AFVTVDSVHHPVQAALHERIDVFGIGALRKRRKAHGVREQYGNRAPFPFELGALAQDLLSQVLGRVRERVRGGRCRLHRRQPLSAASAERTVCAVASLAGHADDLELRAALVTEGGVRGVLVSARWAVDSTTILLRIPVYERSNRAQTDGSRLDAARIGVTDSPAPTCVPAIVRSSSGVRPDIRTGLSKRSISSTAFLISAGSSCSFFSSRGFRSRVRTPFPIRSVVVKL